MFKRLYYFFFGGPGNMDETSLSLGLIQKTYDTDRGMERLSWLDGLRQIRMREKEAREKRELEETQNPKKYEVFR